MSEETPIPEELSESLKSFLQKLSEFGQRKTEDCPYCGDRVTRMEKIGRCVYLRPCNCRLWQGGVPEAWRSADYDPFDDIEFE